MYNQNKYSTRPSGSHRGTRQEYPPNDDFEQDDDDDILNDCSTNTAQNASTNNTRVTIFDRSDPGSKIAKNKQPILNKALHDMMCRELLSDADIKPRFKSNCYVKGFYRAIAVGVSSAAFLKDRVEKLPPPWDGARLEVVYRGMQKSTEQPQRTKIEPKQMNIEAYVPGQLISTEYLFNVITQFERAISTSNWKQHKVRPHGRGHVFTFSIDGKSYKQLDKLDGFIPYFNSGIEFRVLKDEYL